MSVGNFQSVAAKPRKVRAAPAHPPCPDGAIDLTKARTIQMVTVPIQPDLTCALLWIPGLNPFYAHVQHTKPTVEEMQAAVGGSDGSGAAGGLFELVQPSPATRRARFDVYCNEEGRLLGLNPNFSASRFVKGFPLCGPVILVRK